MTPRIDPTAGQVLHDLAELNRSVERRMSPAPFVLVDAGACAYCGHSRDRHDDNPRCPGMCDASLELRTILDGRCDCREYELDRVPNGLCRCGHRRAAHEGEEPLECMAKTVAGYCSCVAYCRQPEPAYVPDIAEVLA